MDPISSISGDLSDSQRRTPLDRAGLVVFLGLTVLSIFGTGVIHAESLTTHRGAPLSLPFEVVGGKVHVQTPWGLRTFQRRDFAEIDSVAIEARTNSAIIDSAESSNLTFVEAWRSLVTGDPERTIQILRSLEPAPDISSIASQMLEVHDRWSKAWPNPDPRTFGSLRSAGSQVARTDHLVLIHKLEPIEARHRLELMEQVLIGFALYNAAHGINLPPPPKLVAVDFDDRRDFRTELSQRAGHAFEEATAHLDLGEMLVITLDTRTTPQYRDRLRAIERERTRLEALRDRCTALDPNKLITLPRPGRELLRIKAGAIEPAIKDRLRELDLDTLVLNLERLDADLGTAAHELVHQLVLTSGLVSRYRDWPVWLHEGYAMQFETVVGCRWAGIGPANPRRIRDWHMIDPRDRPTLDEFLTTGLGPGFDRENYAYAWALVYHLSHRATNRWWAWLDHLRIPSSPSRTNRFDDRGFRRFFGLDLTARAQSLQAHLDDLGQRQVRR